MRGGVLKQIKNFLGKYTRKGREANQNKIAETKIKHQEGILKGLEGLRTSPRSTSPKRHGGTKKSSKNDSTKLLTDEQLMNMINDPVIRITSQAKDDIRKQINLKKESKRLGKTHKSVKYMNYGK